MMANMDKSNEEVYTAIKASSVIEELNNRHRNALAANKLNKTNGLNGNSPAPSSAAAPPGATNGHANRLQQTQPFVKTTQYAQAPIVVHKPIKITPSTSPMLGTTTPPPQPQPQPPQQQQQPPPTTTNGQKDDRWIQIQKTTFTNWINEQLKAEVERVVDLRQDLTSGVVLVKLVNALQQKQNGGAGGKVPVTRKFYKSPQNQHQCLENITFALNAIVEDGVKMVNIGNSDLYNGNLKLMLGLIWHLILRYQIGKTKVPAKKLILAWLNAILPQHRLGNLTSDLNNGIALA
jgi:hypothetical protein